MAKRRLPDLADDHRCTRNGTNWRCHLPRLPGKSYCQKHHLFNLARSKARSKSQLSVTIPAASHSSSNLREIWAFHRTPGGPPRLYARVERRIPNQFLVEATPLIPHPDPTTDAACGLFRPSESTETMPMGSFSHRVWFEVEGGGEEIYKIFPRKGEIWAVEQYGWVEMVSSFGDYEGASGLVLVEEEEGDELFSRRLYDECELIRRFSMEEMWMFAYRVSNARIVGGHSEGLLLQACTVVVEGEDATSLQREETTYHQLEACGNSLNENNVEAQAPDPISNEGESAQSSEGISNMECAGSGGLTSVAIVEYNHQQLEICSINFKEVSAILSPFVTSFLLKSC